MRILPIILILLFITIPLQNVNSDRWLHLINLRIEPLEEAIAEIKPLGSHKFHFKFYNGGIFQRNLYLLYIEFRVEVEGEGWKATVYPTWDFFYPNETKYGFVRVDASSRPSNYAYIKLYGRIRDLWGNWYHANYTFQVKASQYHSFDVVVNNTFIKGRQEEIYSVPIRIRNTGNYEDRFSIIPDFYPPGWKISISQSPVVIPPGGEAIVYIHFAIPHEKVYLQETIYLIRAKVRVEDAFSSKGISILVALEGFHFTIGQAVAFLSSMPSLLIFAFIGAILYRKSNIYNYLPKPWIEEKEELDKLDAKLRRKIRKEMKEEWKSAYYFLKSKIKDDKKLEKLKRTYGKKQKELERKIMDEWKQSWETLHQQWKEACDRIKNEYDRKRREVERKLKEANKKYGIKIDIEYPKIEYPPEPKKPPLPKIPEYKLDEKKGILIEPDEIQIERILMPIRKNKIVAKRDAMKLKEIEGEILEKMKALFEKIERKIDMEIRKIEEIKKLK